MSASSTKLGKRYWIECHSPPLPAPLLPLLAAPDRVRPRLQILLPDSTGLRRVRFILMASILKLSCLAAIVKILDLCCRIHFSLMEQFRKTSPSHVRLQRWRRSSALLELHM